MNTTEIAYLKSNVALLTNFLDAQRADIITTSNHGFGLESPNVNEETPANGE